MSKDIYSARRSNMAKIKPMKQEELKKESEALFIARKAENEALIEAYNAKKLKSARLIRKAQTLIAKDKTPQVENSENF